MFNRQPVKKFLGAAAIASAAMFGTSANALVVDFYNGATLYATMTTTGGTDFELKFLTNANAAAYIDYINLAGPGGTFTDNSTDTIATASYNAGGFTDKSETYNWQIQFPNANNDEWRLTGGETALWSIVDTDPDAWDFNLLHVNAFDGRESIKLDSVIRDDDTGDDDTPIPEPGTLALVGLGMLGAGFVRRRKR